MYVKITLIFCFSVFFSGCDIAAVGFVAVQTQKFSDSNSMSICPVETDIHRIISIADTVAKENGFVKQSKIQDAFISLSPIAVYKIRPGLSDGNLGFLVFYSENQKTLIFNIKGLGGYRNRDLGFNMQAQLFDRLVQTLGSNCVIQGRNWRDACERENQVK
ncbi:MAG: hypothetical protein A2Y07_03120 [Planctomycetes bacterium GWF2_50_10]|nr:MAG: hypothetical protein A2Y07_03120 [Planctomycetes bacterium GWF2_50_10]